MKFDVKLEQGKMSERQVREAIEKASATARNIAAQQGKGDVSHEQMREQMIKHAEKDHKEGKI